MPPTRGFQSFGVLIMKLNVPLKAAVFAPTPPFSPFSIPPSHHHLLWHFCSRAANAACETINHEIENAADDDYDDDFKSKSMQSRLLSQFRQAAESGLPPLPLTLSSIPIPHSHSRPAPICSTSVARQAQGSARAYACPAPVQVPASSSCPKSAAGGREEGRRRRHIEYRSIWARVQTLRSCARHKNPMTLH